MLLLPETFRAEEDNKSHLFEQRAWRGATVTGARNAECCSATGSQVMRVRFPVADGGQVSMRDLVFCLAGRLDAIWMEPSRPSAEAHVSPESLGIDERHGRRGFVSVRVLDCSALSRLA